MGNSSDALALFMRPNGSTANIGVMGNNVGGAQTAWLGSGYSSGSYTYSSNMIVDLSGFMSFNPIFAIHY